MPSRQNRQWGALDSNGWIAMGNKRIRVAAGLAALALAAFPVLASAGEPPELRIVIGGKENSARIFAGNALIAERALPAPRTVCRDAFGHGGQTVQIWRGGGRYGQASCVPGFSGAFESHHGYGANRQRHSLPPARIEARQFSGGDLVLIDLGLGGFAPARVPEKAGQAAPKAPLVAANPAPVTDPAMDQWRLLLDADGGLDANPAPLISTAQMLQSLRQSQSAEAPQGEIIPPDAAIAPVIIRITGASRTMAIADHQRLLNRLGYFAGAEDGVLGWQTRTAIARFEAGLGMAPTGRLTARLSTMIYRAAGAKPQAGGQLTVSSLDGNQLESAAIEFTEAPEQDATHVLVLSAQGDARSWKLLTLGGKDAAAALLAFGVDGEKQSEAALKAIQRVRMSDELKTRLGELAGPGTVLVIGGQPRPQA
jgi:peptidoglycan hydrolase-like protein with peptidoglycan-binding domain